MPTRTIPRSYLQLEATTAWTQLRKGDKQSEMRPTISLDHCSGLAWLGLLAWLSNIIVAAKMKNRYRLLPLWASARTRFRASLFITSPCYSCHVTLATFLVGSIQIPGPIYLHASYDPGNYSKPVPLDASPFLRR